MVVGVREHPLCASLEDGELRHILGDRRRDLEAARPRTDHGHPLASELHRVVPPCRVERRPREVLGPFERRHRRSVELPHSGDHRTRLVHGLVPECVERLDRPHVIVLVPHASRDLGLKDDVLVDAVLAHRGLEVALQLRLAGEVLGPLVGGLEGVAVEVVADVHPGAGVGVLPPGAADALVLLEDGERDVCLGEPDARQQPGLTAPDHHDRQRRPCLLRPRGRARPRVGAVELHLLHEHLDVLVGHLLADEPAHHLSNSRLVERCGLRTPGISVGGDDRERQRPSCGLVFLAHVALDLVQEQARRRELAPAQLEVAGDVDQREQQGGDADVLEGCGDLVIARLERHPSMWIRHGLPPPDRAGTYAPLGRQR